MLERWVKGSSGAEARAGHAREVQTWRGRNSVPWLRSQHAAWGGRPYRSKPPVSPGTGCRCLPSLQTRGPLQTQGAPWGMNDGA